jgi:hypothetical protein
MFFYVKRSILLENEDCNLQLSLEDGNRGIARVHIL